ncbi:hypothetical protein S101258_01731 [Lactiplantibacillus plantarum subsp. plantarum]|uniref:Uncharacterized protein n=1 Tax=Lactiplantibacillus plantarum subsp. plantarum TaxID=337330 RepID=A0A2S3U622_LACPN|nr:hypothetical protein S101258_01731 [Lactiplantibacillus plantarum subsp. plantarum]
MISQNHRLDQQLMNVKTIIWRRRHESITMI